MGITYVGGQTVDITTLQPSNQTITFSLTGGLASVPAIGDLVLFTYQSGTSTDGDMTTKAVTSGYTLDVELYANDTNDTNFALFHKVMGSTPDTTLIIEGVAAAGPGVSVQIMVFRGVSSATPLDVTLTSATGIDTGNVNPPAITPATTGNVIAIFGAAATSTTVRTFTTASTAYMSGFLQNNRAGTNFGVASGAGYVSGKSAGVSYDPAAWAISTDSTGNSWGSVTVALRPDQIAVSVVVTGVSATGEVGTATVTAVTSVSVPATGVFATGEVGAVITLINASVPVTGVTATGAVETVTVSAKATVSLTGVEATGAVGTVTIVFAANAPVTGVEAPGAVGIVQVSADTNTTVSGVQGDGTLGSVTVTIKIRANVTGVSATGAVGTVTVIFNTMVFVTGVTAYGRISSVLVWGNVVPTQDANYASVAPNQNPGYSPINPAQTSVWTPIET